MLVRCYRCSICSSTHSKDTHLWRRSKWHASIWLGQGCALAAYLPLHGDTTKVLIERETDNITRHISDTRNSHSHAPVLPRPAPWATIICVTWTNFRKLLVTSICSLNTHKVSMFCPRVITKSIAVTFSRSCPRYSVTRPDQFFAALAICASFRVRRGLP